MRLLNTTLIFGAIEFMSTPIDLAMQLISRPSVSPADSGCQEILITRLQPLGFNIERLPYGNVTNLWARRGTKAPLFCFVGHTDVVPTGPLDSWHSDPFTPEIRNGKLYGRGAADMKGSIAAMLVAVEEFIAVHPNFPGSIAFLITSDEEALAVDGTVRVMEVLNARNEKIDWCLVGEPTCNNYLGDTIKNGRRGSLSGRLQIIGKQGHIAYPQLAKNPFHASVETLSKLCSETWDNGNEFFPPTSFQISNVHMGAGVDNVIPAQLAIWFNFRFSTALNVETIQRRVKARLDGGGFEYALQWITPHAQSYLTPPGKLVDATVQAILAVTGQKAELSTGGGTSDGRFVATSGAQVLEFGPLNTTIHQINECVGVEELETLTHIYRRVLELIF